MALFDNTPAVLDAAWAIAAGQLADGSAIASRAQGYTATSATSGKAIYATTYTPQGADAQRSIKSGNVNDTAAGTGARQVLLTYLTATFELKTEILTLNGTTAVATAASDIAFVESLTVVSVGSGGGNAGTITFHTNNSGGGTTWASIAASDNQTFWAHHYVPAGRTCLLLSVNTGATVVAGQTTVNVIENLALATSPQLQRGMALVHAAVNSWSYEFRVPLAVPGPSLIWLVERPVAATASTAVAGFEYLQF